LNKVRSWYNNNRTYTK